MDFKFTSKRIFFLVLFFVLVLIGKNINFSPLVGTQNQFFTLFEFFGPTAGAFLGPVFGVIAVLFSQIADFLIVGKEWSYLSVLRFLPALFAVIYFGSKKKYLSVFISPICMFLFILHPVGKQAWPYTLYWLIPLLGIIPNKFPGSLVFRSLGATFTAHAIGGVIWLYTVPMSVEQWITLIPIVAYERILFGLGIAGSYVVFNTVLDYVVDKWKISAPNILFLEKRYSLLRFLSK